MEHIVEKLPVINTAAGPRDPEWNDRLREEYMALITYVQLNKDDDNEWFNVEPDETGIHWSGKCWYIHELVRYEFELVFDIPATYPETPVELTLPELDGKSVKMYRGGKICIDSHFAPLWARHQPKFGIAHALALALGPWLAAEIPHLLDAGLLT